MALEDEAALVAAEEDAGMNRRNERSKVRKIRSSNVTATEKCSRLLTMNLISSLCYRDISSVCAMRS